MALADFIPTVWSARFKSHLDTKRVYQALVNRDYEQDARDGGDVIKIPNVSVGVTVRDYQSNQDLAAPEKPSGDTEDLALDQKKYFNLEVEDVQRVQQRPNLMDEYLSRAAEAVAQAQDEFLAGLVTPTVAARLNTTATAADATGQKVIEAAVELSAAMDRASVPEAGRWMVMHPDGKEKLLKWLLANQSTSVFLPATAEQAMLNGYIGTLAGFSLFITNRVPTSGAGSEKKWNCPASYNVDAVTFAEQMAEIEAYRPEKRFSDAVKGLYVYGGRLIHPDRLWHLQIDDASAS